MQRTFNSKFLMHRITCLSQFFFRKKDISLGHLDLDILNHFQKQKHTQITIKWSGLWQRKMLIRKHENHLDRYAYQSEEWVIMIENIKWNRRELDRLLTLAPSGDDMLVPSLSRTSDPVPYSTCIQLNFPF